MTERAQLLSSLAMTIADYRAGELPSPTPDHVDRWVSQFTADMQLPVLRELDQVLKQTYFTRSSVEGFLGDVVTSKGLAGTNPSEFWKAANFLKIQQNGNSQREMVNMFDRALNAKHNLTTDLAGSPGGPFIYLDDVLFSGDRVRTDLEAWIRTDAPQQAVVHVILIAIHKGGEYWVKKVTEVASAAGKEIDITFWRQLTIENRKYAKDQSEVLWPTALPGDSDLNAYIALPHKFPFEPRAPGGKLGPFSSEQGRQTLERELLLAGVKIRALCANPKDIMRPLGYSRFGLGFGSMIVTFRNCPNNCPLALWWGDPQANASSPLSKWYPLFPRKTYSKEVDWDDFSFA